MGVKGLTSFVQQNSRACMENFELHDTKIVIDGDSAAYQLYTRKFFPKNCCFGGDYDRYGALIKSFFQVLLDCNIKPIFIFDGGYDDEKINTIESRMKDRIRTGVTIDSTSKDPHFPLFLGKLLEDLAIAYKFTVIRCDYEGDLESANISKSLNCPVLSNDSDFYIFDVLYIPLSSLEMRAVKKILKSQSYCYMPCELYRTKKFTDFMRFTIDKLPLFATVLGNDYLNRLDLTNMFRSDQYNRKQNWYESKVHKYIRTLADWLNHESNETAIQKILNLSNVANKEKTEQDINATMKKYITKESKYLYLINSQSNSINVTNNLEQTQCTNNEDFLELFLYNFRKCAYPSCFMNILMQNHYYIRPQVEDKSLPSAHIISIDIISAISKILKCSSEKLQLFTRIQSSLKKDVIPLFPIPVPTYLELQELNLDTRHKLLVNILYINDSFVTDSLIHFPDSWKLYILSIKYLCDKSALNWSLIQAILLCKLVVGYIDNKIGYFRNSQAFTDKHKQEICEILIDRSQTEISNQGADSVCDALDNISYEDSLIAQRNLIAFFEIKSELVKNAQQFNRKIVHGTNQFQSCFYHIGFLNTLLKNPYEHCPISESFNGTFIYNVTNELRAKADENYIAFLLQNAPSVLNCFTLMINKLKIYLTVPFLPNGNDLNV